MPEAFLQDRLLQRERKGLLRQLKKEVAAIDFTSNDYLGLARQETQVRTLRGSTGSRLLSGNHAFFEEVEEKIASFFTSEAALVYSSGYAANVGLLQALAKEDDLILFDQEIHASCHDGMKLTGASCYPFRHNDLEHLEHRLKKCEGRQKFILVEAVYSISGDLSPLAEIKALSDAFDAHLIVDEAHAAGIYGLSGEGLSASLQPFARVVTFGKAFGVHGAAVLGSDLLKNYLVNFSRSFIYSTAPSFYFYTAIEEALEKVRNSEARTALFKNVEYFNSKRALFQTPIKALAVEEAKKAQEELLGLGFLVNAVLPPTVSKESLRFCLHAYNTFDEIDQLIEVICQKKWL